ncbi:MAG: TlpA disulfide reductase family protein [bacterium]|nr:TlpA disulfide reductase family protein [bacterium]
MKTLVLTVLAVLLLGSGLAMALGTGDKAPEIGARKWLNTPGNVTLKDLADKIVVVEFWATWCPPCRKSIPHLIELNAQYKDKGVVFIGLTNEDYKKANIAKFVKEMKIDYIIGTASDAGKKYGVEGIPTAFVVGKDGTILWSGHPMDGLDKALEAALAAKDERKAAPSKKRVSTPPPPPAAPPAKPAPQPL